MSLRRCDCLLRHLVVRPDTLFLQRRSLTETTRGKSKLAGGRTRCGPRSRGGCALLITLNQNVYPFGFLNKPFEGKRFSLDLRECANKTFAPPEIRLWGKPSQVTSAHDIRSNSSWRFQALFWNGYLRLSSPLFFLRTF